MLGLLVFLFATCSSAWANIPKATCELDNNYDKCFLEHFTVLLPALSKHGMPEAKIPPLDPLKVPGMKINLNHQLAKGGIEVKNLVLKGISGSQIQKFKTDVGKAGNDNFVLVEVVTFHPKLSVDGEWSKGSIVALSQNIAKSGKFNVKLDNVKVNLVGEGKLVKHNHTNSYYPYIEKLTVAPPEIQSLQLQTSDLIENDKELSASLLKSVNNMWQVLFTQVHPVVSEHISKLAKQYINAYNQNHLFFSPSSVEAKLKASPYKG